MILHNLGHPHLQRNLIKEHKKSNTSQKKLQVVQQNSGERGHSLSPQNYAIKAKVINAAADEVPERDTNGAENIKEPNLETSSGKEIRGIFSFVPWVF